MGKKIFVPCLDNSLVVGTPTYFFQGDHSVSHITWINHKTIYFFQGEFYLLFAKIYCNLRKKKEP